MILHWKIAFTSLKYSFHSSPNSHCFVLVHFQSHNAPNSPPLHISEMGYVKLANTGQKHMFPPPWESIGYVLETY